MPAGLLRAGNARANTVADHITVLDTALEQIPPRGRMRRPCWLAATPVPLPAASSTPCPHIVKSHCRDGHDIVAGIAFPWPVAEMVLQHHERLDGSGYPDGLRGDDIGIGARIIAVADVVDAMASHRPYRPARGAERALAEVTNGRGKLFDPGVVDALLRLAVTGRLPSLTDSTPDDGRSLHSDEVTVVAA